MEKYLKHHLQFRLKNNKQPCLPDAVVKPGEVEIYF